MTPTDDTDDSDNRTDTSETNVYNVSVVFYVPNPVAKDREVGHEFPDAQQFEVVKEGTEGDQYQTTYGVAAPHPWEAYRRAVNLVEAKLEVGGITDYGHLSVELFGTDGEKVMYER